MSEVSGPARAALASRSEAFRIARRSFLGGQRIEMADVAAAAGVNRVTVHRWFGTRRELLADVVWSLAEPTLRACYASAPGDGRVRIAWALSEFARVTIANAAMRAFIDREGETALRVLTRSDYTFQPRMIDAVHALLAQERQADSFDPGLPLHDLAYLCVRVVESFVYTDLLTGEPPNAERAGAALHFLLRLPADCRVRSG
jgi:AcrR family transcriptional regulator